MRKATLTLLLLLPVPAIMAQGYYAWQAKAQDLYNRKEYLASGLTYDSLFRSLSAPPKATDQYDAACSWARAGGFEKAFYYLTLAVVEGKWALLSHTQADSDLLSLHDDPRWQPLLDQIKVNKAQAEARINKPLEAELDTIFRDDQGPREELTRIMKRHSWKSPEVQALLPGLRKKDSINLVKVRHILDKYGWLGPDVVGSQGAQTLFLVIQHADSLTQVTYLPELQEAVRQGKARPQDLALLQDRVLTEQGKPQIYGSQLRYSADGKPEFFPIEDEKDVDKRRESIGLEPLESYAKRFGLTYQLPH